MCICACVYVLFVVIIRCIHFIVPFPVFCYFCFDCVFVRADAPTSALAIVTFGFRAFVVLPCLYVGLVCVLSLYHIFAAIASAFCRGQVCRAAVLTRFCICVCSGESVVFFCHDRALVLTCFGMCSPPFLSVAYLFFAAAGLRFCRAACVPALFLYIPTVIATVFCCLPCSCTRFCRD